MPTPLPSPNGTNLERLYITRGPMAQDADPGDDPRPMLRMILAKLSDDDKAVLRDMLDGDDDGSSSGATDGSPAWADREYAAGRLSSRDYMNAKKYYGGCSPRAALDKMRRDDPDYGKTFDEMFPDLKRLKY